MQHLAHRGVLHCPRSREEWSRNVARRAHDKPTGLERLKPTGCVALQGQMSGRQKGLQPASRPPLNDCRPQRKPGLGSSTSRLRYFRTMPMFETGDERYLGLNDIVAVELGASVGGAVRYDVFELL